jgi:hypothetical protein
MNKLQRLGLLAPVLLLAACKGQETGFTEPNLGPLAFVRFVHAVPDRGPITGRWVDKVENWVGTPTSGTSLGISYRAVTPFQGVSAGSRHFRLFPATTNIDSTQMVLADVTTDLQANTYYTFLYTGYASCNGGTPAAAVVRITETHPTIAAGKFALRAVIAAPGFASAQDAYVTATATSALPAAPTFSNLSYSQDPAALSALNWVQIDTGSAVIRTFNTGTTTTANLTSTVTAGAPPTVSSTNAAPGSRISGSALTAFIFPQQRTSTCATTGTVQSAYGVDVRPPVPQ